MAAPFKLNYKNFFFVGIGGIGMSALARYFNSFGKKVCFILMIRLLAFENFIADTTSIATHWLFQTC
mgnify:CR=1 FL=1